MPKFVFLWTDLVLWLVVATAIVYVIHVRRNPNLRATWRHVASACRLPRTRHAYTATPRTTSHSTKSVHRKTNLGICAPS